MTKVGLILIAFGLASLASFGLIGSSVDPDGTLREPFGLVPIGFLLLLLGSLLTSSGLVRTMLRTRRDNKNAA